MRILVVEDDPDLNNQIKQSLEDSGYSVDTALDGEEGHFLGDTEPYDAVVLEHKVDLPNPELRQPVVLAYNERVPYAWLHAPVVFLYRA